MTFSLKKTLNNTFQVSTLKAVVALIACFGVTVPDEVIKSVAWGYMVIYGLYETMRDENAK